MSTEGKHKGAHHGKMEGRGKSIKHIRKTCNVDVNEGINMITERQIDEEKQK